MRGVRELEDGTRDHRGWLRWRSDCVDTRRRCGHADETARRREEYRTPDGFFHLPDGGTLLVNLGNARLTRIEVDLSFGETWSIAQGAPGTGLAMISPVGTDRTGGIYFRQRLGGMTRCQMPSTVPPNSRCWTRFSRYSSTTGPITPSRQERQIVQSQLDLDDFLPRFMSPLGRL